MSFSDNGVVFFDANFSNSSISTPTVLGDRGVAVSRDDDNESGIWLSADVSCGFVGSTYEERDRDDETIGFFHPEAVGLFFLVISRCALARVYAFRCGTTCDESCLVPFVKMLSPIALPWHIIVGVGSKLLCVEYSTTLAMVEAGYCCRPCFWFREFSNTSGFE